MKNEVNPTFSRLIVLAFHSDTLDMDAAAVKAALKREASVLQGAIARVREWDEPPTQSQEGREVFYTYANSVHRATERLVAAIDADDSAGTVAELQQIANTCNNCHHFFRLRLRDSVVPSR
jgi:cytochrome c556